MKGFAWATIRNRDDTLTQHQLSGVTVFADESEFCIIFAQIKGKPQIPKASPSFFARFRRLSIFSLKES